MALQQRHHVEPVRSSVRFYIPKAVAVDSAFPFGGGDEFVVRTIRHEAVVLTPPDSDLEIIDLPPIQEDLTDAR